jgi:hypothetical protein
MKTDVIKITLTILIFLFGTVRIFSFECLGENVSLNDIIDACNIYKSNGGRINERNGSTVTNLVGIRPTIVEINKTRGKKI